MQRALITLLLLFSPLLMAADQLDVEQYRGKVVMVDFWASWCVPCRRSFPWMNEMQERYAEDGLVIIAINVDRDEADAKRFLEKYPASFTVVFDPAAEYARQFDVEVMPSSIILSRDGEVLERHSGFKTRKQQEYEQVLMHALGVESGK